MKRVGLAVSVLVLGLSVVAPAASAAVVTATPVPGRFCKVADIGKKVKTVKYGLVVCKREGDRARWK